MEDKECETLAKSLKRVGIHTKWFGLIPKSFNRVLFELYEKWGSISEESKNIISEKMFGEKMKEKFLKLMQRKF